MYVLHEYWIVYSFILWVGRKGSAENITGPKSDQTVSNVNENKLTENNDCDQREVTMQDVARMIRIRILNQYILV